LNRNQASYRQDFSSEANHKNNKSKDKSKRYNKEWKDSVSKTLSRKIKVNKL
jgi:hypothetical protein